MQALWVTLACFSGMFGFAYLVSGFTGLVYGDMKEPESGLGKALLVLDAIFTGCLGMFTKSAVDNWPKDKESRRHLGIGILLMVLCLLFVGLAGDVLRRLTSFRPHSGPLTRLLVA
jgi:purine-cytosine permease-like protein